MKEHYRPFRGVRSLWYFTSPLGLHGPFDLMRTADSEARDIHEHHHARSLKDGAEATLLREYFKPTPAKA